MFLKSLTVAAHPAVDDCLVNKNARLAVEIERERVSWLGHR